MVLEKLIADVLSTRERLALDAILVTGDIAFSGDSAGAKEYYWVGQWLDELAKAVGLNRRNVFIVPGNHDVQRDVTQHDHNARRLLDSLRSGADELDTALAHPSDRKMLEARMANYLAFSGEFAPACLAQEEKAGALYWKYQIVSKGLPIRLVGLNTAILSLNADDKKKLRVGKEQLAKALSQPKPGELIILLSHHPPDWLGDEPEVSSWIRASVGVHLSGHVHKAESERIQSGGGREFVRIVAGAAHGETDEPTGYGYSVASVVGNGQDKLVLRIWPRAWSDKRKEFRLDVDNVPDGTLFAEHPLSLRPPGEQQPIIEAPTGLLSPLQQAKPITIEVSPRSSLKPSEIPGSDSPPSIVTWVGRQLELELLHDPDIKVVVIKGIGGQGKSFLAARYLQEHAIEGTYYDGWDWRDCREEGDTLQTHLIRLIERLSFGRILAKDICGESIESVVAILFQEIKDQRWVCVFDNIDHYVNTEECRPVKGMLIFMEAALKKRHKCRFIFTCRPEILIEAQSYYCMSLPGLSLEETMDLFEKKGINISDKQTKRSIADAHALTQEHPFWLNQIATQVAKNKANLASLVADIRQGKGTALPKLTLRSIWKTVSDKQKLVLQCMAAMIRPETEERLSDCLRLGANMQWNQFNKAIKSLKTLDLIVTKKSPNSKDTLELHPIMKEFIRTEFKPAERGVYTRIIMRYLDSIIVRDHLEEKIQSEPVFHLLEVWITKTELALNVGSIQDALDALVCLVEPLRYAGFSEELVRVCGRLFSEFDWNDLSKKEYKGFDSIIDHYIDILSCLGRYSEADDYMAKYEKAISEQSARFILLCSLRSYSNWLRGNFQDAKRWGMCGVELKKRSSIDTQHDSSHNLALAQRDSGEVGEALTYFLSGHPLEEVLGKQDGYIVEDEAFYGNIGKCLFLQGRVKDALFCYVKSVRLLEKTESVEIGMNKGWGFLWIAEALEKLGELDFAHSFTRQATSIWQSISPPKAGIAQAMQNRLLGEYGKQLIPSAEKDDAYIRRSCQDWLESALG